MGQTSLKKHCAFIQYRDSSGYKWLKVYSNGRIIMPAKKDHWTEMISRAEAQIEKLQTELVFADPPKTEAEEAVILQSIEDQVAKIERLKALQLRLKAK